ncbi:hypothetical protein M8C21_022195 [Ambrosia artemisiifolia]|uniref:Uncharacterized protein n=1 Tax=Ambrosia artemisiifolia TaxID=4212 RepID=A0AAD5CPJ0_AMBAR|nr:hypothetical protein M8C21_022195 [Ambrosia artemisiifolia]
MHSLGEYLTL